MIGLEEQCITCCGSGFGMVTKICLGPRGGEYKRSYKKSCDVCLGRGKVLTEFGAKIIKLIKDYTPWESELYDLQRDIRSLGGHGRDY